MILDRLAYHWIIHEVANLEDNSAGEPAVLAEVISALRRVSPDSRQRLIKTVSTFFNARLSQPFGRSRPVAPLNPFTSTSRINASLTSALACSVCPARSLFRQACAFWCSSFQRIGQLVLGALVTTSPSAQEPGHIGSRRVGHE